MTQICRPAKCIEAIRVTLLDQCTLLPVCGPLNAYAMGCIIDPNWTPEIEEGEESIVKDNCGNVCLRDDRCDLTKRWNIEFKIKDPDKEFLALIEGNPLIVVDGVSIGVRQLSYGSCSPYVMLELFERTEDCQPDGDPIYLRHIFPAVRLRWTGNEREGVFRILQIEGKTRDVVTDNIGTGPFDDIPAGVAVGASPTERIDYFWFEDDFVPALQCGAIEVPCPPTGPGFLLTELSDGADGSTANGGIGVQVAVDSQGRYLVATTVNSGAADQAAVWRFTEAGVADTTWGTDGLVIVTPPFSTTADQAFGVAVDPADDSVYLLMQADGGATVTTTVAKLDSTGAIVAAFGAAGFLAIEAGSQPMTRGIFVESTGNIVVGRQAGFTTATLTRYTSLGVLIDSVAATVGRLGRGIANNNGDGLYALALEDGGGEYIATADITGGTTTEVLVTVNYAFDPTSGSGGVAVDPVSGDIYLSGMDSVQGIFAVVRYDSALVIDAGFGTAGLASIAVGAGTSAAIDVLLITGGDILLTGSAFDAFAKPATARLDSAGVAVGTYGTAGAEVYSTIGPANATFLDSIIENADGRAVHTGWYFDGVSLFFVLVARTLLADGALDPTFG